MGKTKVCKKLLYLIGAFVIPASVLAAKDVEILKTFRSSEEFYSWCVTTHYNPDFCGKILEMHKTEGTQRVEWFPKTFIDKSVIFKQDKFQGCSEINIFSVGFLHNFIYNFRICDRG